jgi:hypothetical protein
MGLAYGGAIVRDGLVLALDAADRNSYPGTGTTWYDLSGNGGTGNWGAAVSSTATSSDGLFITFTYPTTNVFYIDVATFNGSNTLKGYRNGVLVATDTDGTQDNLSTQGTRQNFTIARRDLASAELPCKVASVQVYTKELSSSEVLQNYNATKTRFGL